MKFNKLIKKIRKQKHFKTYQRRRIPKCLKRSKEMPFFLEKPPKNDLNNSSKPPCQRETPFKWHPSKIKIK